MAFPWHRTPSPNDSYTLPRSYFRNSRRFHFFAKMDGGIFQNIPVRDITDGVNQALGLSKNGIDVYIALAEYASHESRKADNVVAVWGFWLDVDCGEEKAAAGKGYPNVEIAANELVRFCAETGIPEPTHVVLSGSGLHFHWVLKDALDPTAWKSTAKKFKQLTEAWGFLADPSRTADIASVLRLPGTRNHKYDPPRPVKLIRASREFIETATFCRQIDEAHSKYCFAPVAVPTRTPVDRDQRQYGPPDMDRLRTALSYLDPDCEEEKWKFYLAAMARAAHEYPNLAEALGNLAIEWSRGDLWHKPSEKWRELGRQHDDR